MLGNMTHVSAEHFITNYILQHYYTNSALRCVALASFKSEIENLKKRVEEIEGENIQLKQTSTKIAEEKKRMVKEADESLESVTKSSAQKLE